MLHVQLAEVEQLQDEAGHRSHKGIKMCSPFHKTTAEFHSFTGERSRCRELFSNSKSKSPHFLGLKYVDN